MSPETSQAEPPPRLLRRCWRVLVLTIRKYVATDGELRAASFAYYAFFALFPLVLLFISIGSSLCSYFWAPEEVAGQVLDFLGNYIPVGPNEQNVVLDTIHGILTNSWKVGAVALPVLAWSALRFFQSLVQGVNRAWGMEGYSWWRLPLANLVMVAIMGSTLLLGVVAPVIMKAIESYWAHNRVVGLELVEFSFRMARLILPSVVLFYGLLMFYKYAPRRKTTFREVWLAAAIVTVALQVVSKGFVIYANNFGRFNALYGTLGSVVAVLMWIYLSGTMIIFGGCLCAAQTETRGEITNP